MSNQRVNTSKAAKILGLRPGTLEVWRHYNRGPRFKKIGRKVFYDVIDLEAFANAYTVETTDCIEIKKLDAQI